MTDTATIEALEAAIARAEDECPNAPYVPVKIELANQSASTIRALSAENERYKKALVEIDYRSTNHGGWFDQKGQQFAEYCKLGDIAQQALKEADTTRAIEKES